MQMHVDIPWHSDKEQKLGEKKCSRSKLYIFEILRPYWFWKCKNENPVREKMALFEIWHVKFWSHRKFYKNTKIAHWSKTPIYKISSKMLINHGSYGRKTRGFFAENATLKSSKFLLFFGHNFHDFWNFLMKFGIWAFWTNAQLWYFITFSVRPKFNVSNVKKCHFRTYRIFISTF